MFFETDFSNKSTGAELNSSEERNRSTEEHQVDKGSYKKFKIKRKYLHSTTTICRLLIIDMVMKSRSCTKR